MNKFSSSAYPNDVLIPVATNWVNPKPGEPFLRHNHGHKSRFEASVDFVQTSLSWAGITCRFINIALVSWVGALIKLFSLWKWQSVQSPGEFYYNYLPDLGKKLKVSSWNVVLKMFHSGGSTLNLITVCYIILTQEWMLLLKAFVLFPTHSTFPVSMSDVLDFLIVLPSQFPILSRRE